MIPNWREVPARYVLGLDLGLRQDSTALAVVESQARLRVVRYLEKLRLGTPYMQCVERVKKLVNRAPLLGCCSVVVDASGVGAPVVEMMKSANLGCELIPVVITGGESARCSDGLWKVPRKELLHGLLVLLERGELKVARGLQLTGELQREMAGIRGHRMQADGHDDLAIALSLAVWGERRNRPRDAPQNRLV